jgi:serine/threonine protein kinase
MTIASDNVTTLSSRLLQSPFPISTALRHALQLANFLRQAHETGQFFGALDPSQIVLLSGKVEIILAETTESAYTAPEVQAGGKPDQRSDIFAFGCVFYEMLTGDRPFSGNAAAAAVPEMLNNGRNAVAAQDYPALLRVLMQCIETNPNRRWQGMQKVFMELTLVNMAARRVDPAVLSRSNVETEMRETVARMERHLNTRIDLCDQSLGELQKDGVDTRDRVRELNNTSARLEATLAGEFAAIQQKVSSQGQSIETLHATIEQTDNLLERVVESLDALQNFVLDKSAEEAGR